MRNEDYINEGKSHQFLSIIDQEFAVDCDELVKEITSLANNMLLLSISKTDRLDRIKVASENDERVSIILDRVGVTSVAHLDQPKTAVAVHHALDEDREVSCRILAAVNNYLIARRDFRKKVVANR